VVLKVVLLKILAMEEEALEQIKIPYFPAKVPAGFPSPAMDYMEERIDLNKTFIEHPLSTFIIQCKGTSMINAFIPPKAKLLIDKSLTPKNGDIVLAVLDGEFTVKFLRKNDHRCFLVPANKKFQEIQITEEMNMQVWGVVTAIIIDTNDVKSCMP
jgi:DNA polymerase V